MCELGLIVQDEIKILLEVWTRPDSGCHVCGFDWNRRRSINWTSDRFEGSESWMEFGC
jgi:hypothetical protein